MLIDKPLKVARPVLVLTATVAVPLSVPPPALFWIARVTFWEVPVTALPFASWSVTTGWVAQAVPPVPPPGCVVKASFAAAPAFTVNALPVPLLLEAVAVIVNEPVFVIVTLCGSSTPATKLPEVTGLPVKAPVEVRDAVETNDVTVLLFTSCAVRRRLNAVPAIWVPIAPPPVFSTLK